jgi:ribosome biogenesis GTPase
MADKAKILKGVGGLYTAELLSDCGFGNDETINCRAKGSFRRSGIKPLPGDIVEFEKQSDGTGFITKICERKNSLIRPASANIDLILFVIAAAKPDPDLFLIDKMLSVATHNRIDVLMIINKSDIDDKKADELCEIYKLAGFDAISFSALCEDSQEKKDYIRNAVKGKVCFFAGASGVGKSSTINSVFPELGKTLETGSLSEKIERGKHTTRKTELFKLSDGTYIADTPGFSMLEIAQYNMIPKDCLLSAFPDIEKYSLSCKYSDCTHVCEDGCRVIEAIGNGLVSKSRHESYRALFEELKNKNEWD